MKRRLLNAYDAMTMPEQCSDAIELRLQQEISAREAGENVKLVRPAARKRPWAVAVAAVWAVLILSVGGTALFLWGYGQMPTATAQATVPETTVPALQQAIIVEGENVTVNIPLDTADALGRQKKANEAFRNILEGETFTDLMDQTEVTLAEYCERRQTLYEKTVTIPAFALVDMDRDGVKELVCRVNMEGNSHENFLMLRWEQGAVRGYPCDGQMYDLKKDGSFYWMHDAKRQGESVLEFVDDCLYMSWAPQTEQESAPVLWHTYPCTRPDFVLGSYAYVSGAGESLLPGTLYWEFELLADGSAGNDWAVRRELWLGYGMVWEEESGSICVYDPDAPGTVLYGSLTEDGTRFSELGFYICTEDAEYQAEVRQMDTDSPAYWVDGVRQVADAEELLARLNPIRNDWAE